MKMTSPPGARYSAASAYWGRASQYQTSEYEDQQSMEDESKLPHFRTFLFATILEDAITQMRIFDECNTELKLTKVMLDMINLLSNKYNVEKPALKDELDGIDPKRLGCLEYSLNKLKADRELTMKVLNDTYFNLTTKNSFDNLTQSVFMFEERRDRLSYLITEEAKNKGLCRDLNRQLRQQRNHFKSVTYDKNNAIDVLKTSLQDAEIVAATRSRYVEGWQRSRSEQHDQTIIDKETPPTNKIQEYKMKIEQEQHVHSEIELLFNIKIQEVIEKVETWMKKYDTDIEKIDLKIQKIRNLHENTYERRLRLEKTLVVHEELAKNWTQFKVLALRRAVYHEKMQKSAITIQAWWRGLLIFVDCLSFFTMPSLSIPKKTRSFGSNTDKYENGFQKKKSYVSKDFDENEEYESNFKVSNGEKKCLTYLQSSLFATILEDSVTEMRILLECNNELRAKKAESDMAILLRIKFCIKQPDVTDELEDIDPHNLEIDKYKLDKLDSDRSTVINVIIATYKNLIENKNYVALEDHVNGVLGIDDYRLELAEEETRNRIMRKELNKQLRQQRNHMKTVIYDTDAVIEELNLKVEDATLHAEICSRYVDRWQVARTEQHHQAIHDKEAAPSSVIEYYKHRTDSEQRVHAEVELLFSISINETLEKVDQWMAKYDKDMENIDLKIQIKKNDYYDMLDKRINLEETIEKHDQLMKEWIEFKVEREKIRAYREKMTKSAIMVQAWWRGLLVRRQLGPYRVSKKKGGRAKKK
nr:uncharacterized protein LOC116773212 [Danaus plexippus plexippus]